MAMDNLGLPFVGNYIELITIDLRRLRVSASGNNLKYITNSQGDIEWNGGATLQTYTYLPCEISGITSGPNNQSATLKVSNIGKEMTDMYLACGAFSGGKVSRIRTFLQYAGATGSAAQYDTESWKITQLKALNREEVILSLNSDISESNAVVPAQIMSVLEYPGMIES